MRFFHFFSYGLSPIFVKSYIIIYHVKMRKKCRKKKLKKKRFSFLQTFFFKSILDIFLCPISKLKKKFWKFDSLPLFRPFLNYYLSSIFRKLKIQYTKFTFLLEHFGMLLLVRWSGMGLVWNDHFDSRAIINEQHERIWK